MTDRLQKLADSYLDHIRVAVEAGDRGAPFRDFVDNWNAYRSAHPHHRSKGDRPRWFNNPSALSRIRMLETLDFRSAGANRILERAQLSPSEYQNLYNSRDKSVKLIIDHAIPIGVIVDQLFTGQLDLTREGIGDHLAKTYRLGLLSHEEDMALNSLGLRSKMPSDWDRCDVFARYSASGISTVSAK